MTRAGLLCLALIIAAPACAQAAQEERSALQYRAPAGSPVPRRVGGAVRGIPPALPRVFALVPDHLGLTTQEQPTLYWYLSAPTGARIEIVVVEPGMETPLLEVAAEGATAGVRRIDLSKYGVRLRTGVEYEWSVALVADGEQRSRDIVSGGAIMRIRRSAELHDDAATLAASGHWYDALMALERNQSEVPSDAAVRALRAALLDQVGLGEVALFERRP